MLVMVEDLRTHDLDLIFNLLFLYCLTVSQISLIKEEQRQLNAIQFSPAQYHVFGDSNNYYLMMIVMMKA